MPALPCELVAKQSRTALRWISGLLRLLMKVWDRSLSSESESSFGVRPRPRGLGAETRSIFHTCCQQLTEL